MPKTMTEIRVPETAAQAAGIDGPPAGAAVFTLSDVEVRYNGVPAVREVALDVREREIVALIGPSGCGKSTLLRCLNRMNDLIGAASVHGSVRYHEQDLYEEKIDPVQVRQRIGMVFQK